MLWLLHCGLSRLMPVSSIFDMGIVWSWESSATYLRSMCRKRFLVLVRSRVRPLPLSYVVIVYAQLLSLLVTRSYYRIFANLWHPVKTKGVSLYKLVLEPSIPVTAPEIAQIAQNGFIALIHHVRGQGFSACVGQLRELQALSQ